MPTALVNGINLYYEEHGSGEPLVFIPGLGGTTDLWSYQKLAFQSKYRTILFDPRGAGRSDKPDMPYTMDMFASDLSALLDFLKINEKIHLVGASLGGVIAQAFVHDYKDQVKKLVLSCTGVSMADPHVTYPPPQVAKVLKHFGTTVTEQVDSLMSTFYHPSFVAKYPQMRAMLQAALKEPQPQYAYQAQLAAAAHARPYYAWLSEIDIPVLIIHGADDLIWPIQNAHTLMKGIGANAELEVLPETGHLLMHERPTEFNTRIMNFLDLVKVYA